MADDEDTKSLSISPMKDVANESVLTANSAKKKKSRHRNRKLYSDILKQMEFYFSDSNLQKDKFLRENMLKEGWIDVEIFASFNKIKTITTDVRVLIRALGKSTVLELDPEGKRVRRKSAFVPPDPQEVDRRTVYLEPLPVEADHSFVANILKPCGGRVLYVSLPRFKRSKQFKGFAFVEFDTVEAAEKACDLFSPTRLPGSAGAAVVAAAAAAAAAADPVSVIGKFPHTNKQLESLKRRAGTSESTNAINNAVAVVDQQGANKGAKTRNRTSSTSNSINTTAEGNNAAAVTSQTDNAAGHSQIGNPHQHPHTSHNNNNPSDSSNKFWVISKQRWLELKREYIDLQKQRISVLRQIVNGKNPCADVTAIEVKSDVEKGTDDGSSSTAGTGAGAATVDASKKVLGNNATSNVGDKKQQLKRKTTPVSESVKPKHIKFTDTDEDTSSTTAPSATTNNKDDDKPESKQQAAA